MSPVVQIQRRMMELGRVRLGEKGARGEPRKLETFRFTSASKQLLDAVATLYGGDVREWKDAPDQGYWEVTTTADQLNIILPPVFSTVDGSPTTSYSQWYELWSGGGCARRCDGVTESLSGKPCLCNPDARDCKITTRVSFMLPEIPGLGVWRLESHGWNAAVELPGTLEVLLLAASESRFIPAVLRIEQRTKKTPGEPTKRFIVPVIDLPQVRVGELLSGDTPNALAINPPTTAKLPRPELPAAGSTLPDDPSFEQEDADTAPWGPPPAPQALADGALVKAERLLGLVGQVGGDLDATERAIVKNRDTHESAPAKHVAWLDAQLQRAEEKAAAAERAPA